MSIRYYFRPAANSRRGVVLPTHRIHRVSLVVCALSILIAVAGGSIWWLVPATAAAFLCAAIESVFIGPHEMDRRSIVAESDALIEARASARVVDDLARSQVANDQAALERFVHEERMQKDPVYRFLTMAGAGAALYLMIRGLTARDVQ